MVAFIDKNKQGLDFKINNPNIFKFVKTSQLNNNQNKKKSKGAHRSHNCHKTL